MGQPLPPPSGSAGPDAPQDMVGPLGCQSVLLTHIQFIVGLPALHSWCLNVSQLPNFWEDIGFHGTSPKGY